MIPFLSIIIPTYNRASLLHRSINSVLNQQHTDYELIIVDDASSDNTQEILVEYQDPKIIKLVNQENSGVSYSRNKAARAANGEYLFFLDDDDELLPDALSEIFSFLTSRTQPLDFAWCSKILVTQIDGKVVNQEVRSWSQDSEKDKHDLEFFNYWSNPGFIVRSDCLLKMNGYDENLNMLEDIDLVVRLLAQEAKYAAISKPLLYVHVDPKLPSLSRHRNIEREIRNLEIYGVKNKDFFEKTPLVYKRYVYSLLPAYYRAGRLKEARKLAWKFFKKFPLDIKLLGRLVEFELIKRCEAVPKT